MKNGSGTTSPKNNNEGRRSPIYVGEITNEEETKVIKKKTTKKKVTKNTEEN
jgi:hypothetical protein